MGWARHDASTAWGQAHSLDNCVCVCVCGGGLTHTTGTEYEVSGSAAPRTGAVGSAAPRTGAVGSFSINVCISLKVSDILPSLPLPRSVGVTDCGKRVTNSSCPNCAKLHENRWFNEEQESQCRAVPRITESLSKGARAAIVDCQRRFNESRWNCSTLFGDHLFGAFIELGTCCFCWCVGVTDGVLSYRQNQGDCSAECLFRSRGYISHIRGLP
jgi:hypothetical protein